MNGYSFHTTQNSMPQKAISFTSSCPIILMASLVSVPLTYRVVSNRHVFHSGTVEGLGLEEDDGIRVTDGGQEKTFGISWTGGHHHL